MNTHISKSFSVFVAATTILLSCNEKEATLQETRQEDMVFTAAWGKDEDSRTLLAENGTDILWSVSEKINVFYGNKYSGVFTSTNPAPAATADFTGSLDILVGDVDPFDSQSKYYAVYPYNQSNQCDGQSVTLSLSSNQTAVPESFQDKFFPAVARSRTLNLSFYNVCGGACFSVTQEGVEKVVFRSNDGSPIAGIAKCGFGEDEKPVLSQITEAKDSIVLIAQDGGFVPGAKYYAAMLPESHKQGISVTLYTATKRAVRNIDNPVTIHRSVFGLLENIDENLEYEVYNVIDFADARIKQHCLEAFDTNGDGELTYPEAAAVTDISKAFTSTLYTSFDEFRFFTSVTSIPANWFKDRARLKSISFPVSITSVGDGAFAGCAAIKKAAIGAQLLSSKNVQSLFPDSYASIEEIKISSSGGEYSICAQAFQGCAALTELALPGRLKSIGKEAFQGCAGLTKIRIPDLASWLGINFSANTASPFYTSGEGHLYVGASEMTKVVVPEGTEEIKAYIFYNCTGITELSLPSSIRKVNTGVFYGCNHLKAVSVPSVDTWVNITFSSRESAPFNASGEGLLYVNGSILKSLNLPQEATKINAWAFLNCTGIEEMNIPDKLSSVAEDAFSGCSKLKKATIPSLSVWMKMGYQSQGSAPFNASGEGHLYFGNQEITEPLIPEEVTEFKAYCFFNCTGFVKMILEPTVPPTLRTDALTGTTCLFVVWDECLNKYKTSWSSLADRIIPESQL